MQDVDEMAVASLINKGDLKNAEILVKEALRKNKMNGKAWFLRGLISLKRGEFDYAIEAINLAIAFKYVDDYVYRALGYAYFNRLDLNEALKSFSKVVDKEVDDYFMIAAVYMLLHDPKSAREFINMAYEQDPKRTKELLIEFYRTFIRPANELTEKEKEFLLKKINSIKI